MKIKIIKAESPNYWYFNAVGHVIDCSYIDEEGEAKVDKEVVFIYDDEDMDTVFGGSVSAGDFEIVS